MNNEMYEKKWYIFTLAACGVFMSTLDGSIVNIALPAILDDFDTKLSIVEWVIMIYLLTVTSLLITCGKLSDIYGHKNLYITGLVLFTISSLLCAVSPNIFFLIFSRMLQGLSSAIIMACTPALLVSAFPPSERGKAFGINAMVVSCGLTAGPALGGFLVKEFFWEMIFYINIPVGIIGAAGSYFVLNKDKKRNNTSTFDIKGTILATTAIGTFLFAITHGYEWGFTSKFFILLIISSIICFILFLINETKVDNPVLNLYIFKNKMLSISSISGVLLFIILFVIIFLMPFYLMKAKGLDSKSAGYIMMVPFAFLFFISPISGNISDRIGSRFLCALGFFILALGTLMFAFLNAQSSVLKICVNLSLVGIGTAVFTSPNSASLMSSIPKELEGIGGAVMATARNLGMVLGIAFAGAIFNFVFHSSMPKASLNNYNPQMEQAFMAAFSATMKITAALALISVIITFMRGKEQSRQRSNK